MNATARLSEHVWRLGSYHVACYLVRGAGASALFEVGVTVTTPLVLAQLDALGVPRPELRYLVLSHAHADHAAGQAGLMAGLPRGTLLLSPASRDFLAKPSTAALYQEEDAYTSAQVASRDGLLGQGPPPALTPLLPSPWQTVETGAVLEVGGVRLALLAADGHVPGGFIAHLPEEGVVLASDSAGFATPAGPAFPLYFVSYSAYQETLAGIRNLRPQALGLGHQVWHAGRAAADYLARTAEHLAAARQAIRARQAAGALLEDLARDLFDTYYHGELSVYSAPSILNCCRLLVRRSLED